MKKTTKRTILIWLCGIVAEICYALIIVLFNKIFGLQVNSMFYFITSSLILSVCLYFDKFHIKKGKTVATEGVTEGSDEGEVSNDTADKEEMV